MLELSDRERDVLQMLWDGLTVKEIAHALGLAPTTVKNYRDQLGRKLVARNQVQLVRKGLQAGVLSL